MTAFSSKARHKARRLALQGIYQWQFSQRSAAAIATDLLAGNHDNKLDQTYFQDLLQGVIKHVEKLDTALQPFSNRPLEELTPIELAVLRIAAYELQNRLDVPWRVIINEALELTKIFGTQEGYRFVNGVLDKLARQIRAMELGPAENL